MTVEILLLWAAVILFVIGTVMAVMERTWLMVMALAGLACIAGSFALSAT